MIKILPPPSREHSSRLLGVFAHRLAAGLAFFVLTAGMAAAAAAQDTEDCILCHEDPDLTGERSGREISMHVDPAVFAASRHGDFDCVDCHQDIAEVPHDDDLAPVACGDCHAEESEELASARHGGLARGSRRAPRCADCHGSHAITSARAAADNCASCHASQARTERRSLHGQAAARGDELAPTCGTCHGSHEIPPAADRSSPTAVMNVPLLCGRCHREGSPVSRNREISQDNILGNYSMSIHGEGLYRQGLTVTAVCTSCHTAHSILRHDDPASSIHHENVASTCATCHGQIEQVHRKVIEGRLWEEEPHKIPACVDCHSPHKIRRVFYPAGLANKDCLRCHADETLTMQRDGATFSLYVDEEAYAASMHNGTACAQCHADATTSLERACSTISAPVDCSICHAEPASEYRDGIHGSLHAAGDPDAPYCLDCHDKHATQDNDTPASPTFPQNVPALCGRCHQQGKQAAVRITGGVPDILQSYIDSIHGKGLLESGLVVTATCADCHTAHGEKPPSDETSTVHHDNIAGTCGACHRGIAQAFAASIHSPGAGEADAEHRLPSCEGCHSSHTIRRTDRTDFRFEMMDQCGRCHEQQAETFFDTFHGKVSRLGSAGAAKCYDCHGTHGILPASDPASTLSREHVVETCGQCHEGSHRRFAGYLTHATHHDPDKYPWLFWSFWGMTALLVGTLTFALLHTLAWLLRLWLSRDEWRAHKALSKANAGNKLYRRFNRLQRGMHLAMLLSFFTLALTGMILKFSYMSWAQGIAWALGGFETTGALHRLGAVILVVTFGVHLWDVIRRKRRDRRSWLEVITGPDSIVFNRRDLTEVVQSIRWFFGLGPRPRYGRYTYWEKFDYFAVFWGVLVIGSTGLVLWLPELFTRILPGWSVNVATIVHSDEALLAVGFIFTIHFFNTHFRPDKFPMDPVIFTGRVTVDELKYDKPDEYARLVAAGELDRYLVGPHPRLGERAARIFGFLALAVGLTLIALIVYTMLLGYR
jgi:cytochrome b subunit of formate dehydrogenase